MNPKQQHKRTLVEISKRLLSELKLESVDDILKATNQVNYRRLFSRNGVIILTQDFDIILNELEAAASKILGSKAANRKTIRDAAMASCRQVSAGCSNESTAEELVETILSEAGREYTHVCECYVARFTNSFQETVAVGPVRLLPLENVLSETKLGDNKLITLEIKNSKGGLFIRGAERPFISTRSAWAVEVSATKGNVPVEARWQIEVAISLMRLSSDHWKGHYPWLGEIEPLPTVRTEHRDLTATYDNESLAVGGSEVPHWYEIDSAVAADLRNPKVQENARHIFKPNKQSLAERVGNGLGWMTRGRQALDGAQRVLSFATSLESLLSSSDKGAPVVQTICRHAAVILTNDVEDRLDIFNDLKKLYDLRSAIVHTGSRSVLKHEAESIQDYAEAIYKTVLQRCNLSMTQDRFSENLRKASHGARWLH